MKIRALTVLFLAFAAHPLPAQNHGETVYQVPNGLIEGAAFKDLFLPQPLVGKLSSDLWGAPDVLPRDSANGIEDAQWSYWGGNVITGDDGREHMFVCRWLESAEKGHFEYHDSEVVHAVADDPNGPFVAQERIGMGHNPEVFRAKDGSWVLFVNEACYLADDLNGPWRKSQLAYDLRDTGTTRLVNHTFAPREDGSVLMISRQGHAWVSEDGLRTFRKLTTETIYPPVPGRFEDPVVWRDEVQYHLIVNDWFGRIAYYLRSPDGVHWTWDDGAAYDPGVITREDGTTEGWYKLERPKVRQDPYGRATHMYFAVIDWPKHQDLGNDRYSSKNVSVPLRQGRRMQILNGDQITSATPEITVKLLAEPGFAPGRDLDLTSLRFGATDVVNFGKGAEVVSSEPVGDDLHVTFAGAHGITAQNFAAKLLGQDREGGLQFGYARLPEYDFIRPLLFARPPRLARPHPDEVEVWSMIENFGQVSSAPTIVNLKLHRGDEIIAERNTIVNGVPAYQAIKLDAHLAIPSDTPAGATEVTITIDPTGLHPETLHLESIKLP